MSTSFTYGSTTVTMDHDPLHPRSWEEAQEFASGSDSVGAAYAYDCGAPVFRAETLLFPAEQYNTLMALLDFLETIVGGSRRLFTWNDRKGIVRIARYRQVAYQQVSRTRHRISLTLEVQS